MTMERDEFIQLMIQALSEYKPLTQDDLSTLHVTLFDTKVVSTNKRTSQEIYQTLCYDYPEVSSEEIMILATDLKTWLCEMNTSSTSLSLTWLENFTIHETFIRNLYSLASHISSNASSSDEIKEDNRSLAISQLTYLITISMPTMFLCLDIPRSKLTRIVSVEIEISWIKLFQTIYQLLLNTSSSYLYGLTVSTIQELSVVNTLLDLIRFCNEFLLPNPSPPTPPISVRQLNTIRNYLNHQLVDIDRNEHGDVTELSEESKEIVDCLKEIFTKSVFLLRDLFIQYPELIPSSNLSDICATICGTASLSPGTDPGPDVDLNLGQSPNIRTASSQQYLQVVFISGLCENLSIIAMKEMSIVSKHGRLDKSISTMQSFLGNHLPKLGTIAELVLKKSNTSLRSDNLKFIWLLIPIIKLYVEDSYRVIQLSESALAKLHENLLSSRLLIPLLNTVIMIMKTRLSTSLVPSAEPSTETTLIESFTYVLAEVVLMISLQRHQTCEYILSYPDFLSTLIAISQKYRESIIRVKSTEAVSDQAVSPLPVAIMSLGFVLSMSIIKNKSNRSLEDDLQEILNTSLDLTTHILIANVQGLLSSPSSTNAITNTILTTTPILDQEEIDPEIRQRNQVNETIKTSKYVSWMRKWMDELLFCINIWIKPSVLHRIHADTNNTRSRMKLWTEEIYAAILSGLRISTEIGKYEEIRRVVKDFHSRLDIHIFGSKAD